MEISAVSPDKMAFPGSKSAHATNGAPDKVRHREQWQYETPIGSPETVTAHSPQKHAIVLSPPWPPSADWSAAVADMRTVLRVVAAARGSGRGLHVASAQAAQA